MDSPHDLQMAWDLGNHRVPPQDTSSSSRRTDGIMLATRIPRLGVRDTLSHTTPAHWSAGLTYFPFFQYTIYGIEMHGLAALDDENLSKSVLLVIDPLGVLLKHA